MDSGFNDVSMTTNHSMTAAQAVLTINPSNHEASDTRGNTAPLGDVSKRYTAFETRYAMFLCKKIELFAFCSFEAMIVFDTCCTCSVSTNDT